MPAERTVLCAHMQVFIIKINCFTISDCRYGFQESKRTIFFIAYQNEQYDMTLYPNHVRGTQELGACKKSKTGKGTVHHFAPIKCCNNDPNAFSCCCYSHIQHRSVLLLASLSVFQAYCILKQRPSWHCCVFSTLHLGWMADFLAWFLLLVGRGICNLPLHFFMRKTHVFKSQWGNSLWK